MKIIKSLIKKFDALRFAIVGVMNTVLDFTILNVLITVFNAPLIAANIMSTTTVMGFSFMANKALVFTGSKPSQRHRQMVLFVAGTLIGLYVLQTLIIQLLTVWWTAPIDQVMQIIGRESGSDVLPSNIAKLAATAVSMVWNYYFYKKVVFKK